MAERRGARVFDEKMEQIVSTTITGDIRWGQMVHNERVCGKCKTRDDAVQRFAAACDAIGVTLDHSSITPRKDRWGSAQEAEREQAPGIGIHRISPRAEAVRETCIAKNDLWILMDHHKLWKHYFFNTGWVGPFYVFTLTCRR